MTVKLYPRDNIEAGLLTYDRETEYYVVYSSFNCETGEYERTFTTADCEEAWTAYIDAVDIYVRRTLRSVKKEKRQNEM